MKVTSLSLRRVCHGGISFLLVILVVGILAFFLGAFIRERYFHGFSCALPKSVATDAKIQQLCAAVRSYETFTGKLPTADQGLMALVERPSGLPKEKRWVPVAKDYDLLDGWKTPFAYRVPIRKYRYDFEIVSAGPDRVMNTPDDISSVRDGD